MSTSLKYFSAFPVLPRQGVRRSNFSLKGLSCKDFDGFLCLAPALPGAVISRFPRKKLLKEEEKILGFDCQRLVLGADAPHVLACALRDMEAKVKVVSDIGSQR